MQITWVAVVTFPLLAAAALAPLTLPSAGWETRQRSAHPHFVQTNGGYPAAGAKGKCGTLADWEGIMVWQEHIFNLSLGPSHCFIPGDLQ